MAQPAMKDEAALRARIAELEAKLAKKNTLSIKTSAKGAVSVYGLQRFPVTLYKAQWERLFSIIADIKAYMVKHADELTEKEEA